MEIYYMGLLFLTLLWILLRRSKIILKRNIVNKKKKDGFWCFIAWLILSLIEGLRSFDIGTDTSMYAYLFTSNNMESFETGFRILGACLYAVTDNPIFFLMVISFITNGLIIFSIYRVSSNPYISVFSYIVLYYYFQSFNAMRQYIAIGLILVAYSFLRQNQFIKYLIGIFISIFFHSSAVVGILLLPYHFITTYNKASVNVLNVLKNVIFPLVIGVLIIFSFNFGLTLLTSLFPKYLTYLQMDYFDGINVVQQIVVNSSIFLAYIIFTNNREFVFPLGTAVALSCMISSVGILMRFVWYFDIFSIFAIAEVWNTNLFEEKSKVILRIAIILLGLSFMTYYLYMNVMRVANYSISL